MAMKVALVGKGGSGKTSIAGTLARLLARRGHPVLAIDGDPNPNLAFTLGIDPALAAEMPGLPAELVEATPGGFRLTLPVEHVCAEYSIKAPDGVRLLALRAPETAGTGCLGGLHTTVRTVVALVASRPGELCVFDVEGSLEHFCQNKAAYVDTLAIVVEPYFRSLETGRRMIGLARQLSPERLVLVANKVRDVGGTEAVAALGRSEDVAVLGEVPHDPRMLEADLAARPLLDFDPQAPAIAAIEALADALLASDAPVPV